MAYISQEVKAKIAPVVKAICKKYGVKASLSISNHSTLNLNIKSADIDLLGCTTRGYDQVNVYHYKSIYTGTALEFFNAVIPAMNMGNHDNSDSMTDYFDVGWYVYVNVGRFCQPFVFTGISKNEFYVAGAMNE